MRTTVTLADDVAAEIQRLRRERGVGTSEALNELARRGLAAGGEGRERFEQRTHPLGLRIDPTDVADAIETLDGPAAR
jgi:Ribbon-helix-helix protein, copG family